MSSVLLKVLDNTMDPMIIRGANHELAFHPDGTAVKAD
jgi:hypothetical protein